MERKVAVCYLALFLGLGAALPAGDELKYSVTFTDVNGLAWGESTVRRAIGSIRAVSARLPLAS